MRWYRKWFLKNIKSIILMHFWVKSTLKSNRNYTLKHPLSGGYRWWDGFGLSSVLEELLSRGWLIFFFSFSSVWFSFFFHYFCFLFFSFLSSVWLNFQQFILLISSCFAKQSFFFNLISNFFLWMFRVMFTWEAFYYITFFFFLENNNFFFQNTFKYLISHVAKFLKNKLYLYNLSILRKNHKNSFFILFRMHIGFHN